MKLVCNCSSSSSLSLNYVFVLIRASSIQEFMLQESVRLIAVPSQGFSGSLGLLKLIFHTYLNTRDARRGVFNCKRSREQISFHLRRRLDI